MSTKDRVALVTGAGSGIGRAAALALLGDGYRVVLTGRRRDALEATRALSANPSHARAVPCDVSDPSAVAALFAECRAAYGRLDVLFNNAGRAAPAVALEDVTYAQWQAVVEVNLTGMFLCTQQAFKLMRDQDPRGGRIINNGSISANTPRPNSAPYTATKHAVTGLTKSCALDGRKYDIACSQIDIGNAATELTERMATGIQQANGSVVAEPRMAVEHVANAILHIANLPLDANVLFMTLMATQMPYVGRG